MRRPAADLSGIRIIVHRIPYDAQQRKGCSSAALLRIM
jgi:hypothetical protein